MLFRSLLGLLFFVSLSISQAHAEIVIKFSHVVAENTPKGQMAQKFQELVKQRLDGKVTVEVYPNAQLYNDDASLPALLFDDIQLVAISLSKFEKYTDKFQLFDLPFLFNDIQAVERFQQSEAGKALLKVMEPKGFTGLGYLHNGLKQFSANKPLRAPADAVGLKFRIQSSDVLAAQFQALDAIPIKKPFSEVFTLLQTNAIDGQENTWSNIYSRKFFEVQEYITESNHGVIEYLVATSTEFWNGLPDDIRSELEQILSEAIAYGNALAVQKADEDKQKIAESGRSEIIQLNAEQRAQWVETMKPVWGRFEDEIGKDLIDAALSANDS